MHNIISFLILKYVIKVISICISLSRGSELIQDYCEKEMFQPECSQDEVIVMTKAVYGRMKKGRCIEEIDKENESNPRFLGCFTDVLHVMEEKCSGRRSCDVSNFDKDLRSKSPCFKGLMMYLQAGYYCARVEDGNAQCLFQASNQILTHIKINPQKIFNSRVLNKHVCGTNANPWILEASPGHHLNVSLINLHSVTNKINSLSNSNLNGNNLKPKSSETTINLKHNYLKGINSINDSSDLNSYHDKNCWIVINIKDRNYGDEKSICHNANLITQHLFKSAGNSIEIKLKNSGGENLKGFLLQFEAFGCPDLIPAEDTWLKRKNDLATIGCYTSRQTWKLKCNGHHWQGVIGNCSLFYSKEQLNSDKVIVTDIDMNDQSKIQILWVLAISGVGIAVCLIIVFIGYIFLKRPKSKNDLLNNSIKLLNSMNSSNPNHDYNCNSFLVKNSSKNEIDEKFPISPICNEKLNDKYNETAYFVLEQ